VDGTISGISLCFELRHLLEGHEKIFCVVFVGNMTISDQQTGGLLADKSADSFESTSWRQVCRTEAYKIEAIPEPGSSLVDIQNNIFVKEIHSSFLVHRLLV
jgi:hypothetical protein